MKNIHILPTDKPSNIGYYTDIKDTRLYILSNGNKIGNYKNNWNPQNIYITNDEEIKEGDAYITKHGEICKSHNGSKILLFKTDKKIILTTDEDLISKTCVHNFVNIINDVFKCTKCKKQVLRSKITHSDIIDGVQAIPDDFLEWFVKNPSCEFVEINKIYNDYGENDIFDLVCTHHSFKYKIIISKEEHKPIHEQIIDAVGGEDRFREIAGLKPKKETLEEAAEKRYPFEDGFQVMDIDISEMLQLAFINGAKWQVEQDKNKFSEEEMENIVNKTVDKFCTYFQEELKIQVAKEWFEQFKKK